ncbi:MAG: gas vesicle protein GvpG [Burkholderiaceae bacterium]|nr:gas vesicle protein GvpG [Burkholderiaceae bacterium]
MNPIRIAFAAAVLGAALLAGCGSDQYVTVSGTTTISKGQELTDLELTDLQRALNEGAITQSEYDKLRDKVMRRPN